MSHHLKPKCAKLGGMSFTGRLARRVRNCACYVRLRPTVVRATQSAVSPPTPQWRLRGARLVASAAACRAIGRFQPL
eukprot:4633756-Pyramimonas_sp.AAC.1